MKYKALVAGLALCASPAFAGEFSLGGGVNYLDDGDLSITSPALTYGYRFNDTFSIGGEIASGGDDTYDFVNVDLDSYVTVKAQFGGKVGDGYMYVSAGAYDIRGTGSGCLFGFCASLSDDSNGGLLGVGGQIPLSEKWLVDFSFDRAFGDIDNTKSFVASVRYRF